MDFVLSIASQTGLSYLVAIGFLCILFAAELALPVGRGPRWGSRLGVLMFAALFIPTSIVASRLVNMAAPRPDPLMDGMAGTAIGTLLGILIGDFFYYWFHRAQHRVPFLWRFHAIHHSVEEMSAPAAHYQHVSEPVFKAVFVAVPTSLLIRDFNAGVLGTILAFQGFYAHSSTRLNLGRFAQIVADNRMHRIHHSREPAHFDRNFGGLFMVWDRLFGTLYVPAPSEWPDTGLAGQPQPRAFREYLWRPFLPEPRRTSQRASAAHDMLFVGIHARME